MRKRIRSTIYIAVVVVMGLTAAACGGSDNSSGSSGGGGGSSVQTLQSGTLSVGSDIPYPPFESGDTSNPKGFDVEVLDGVAKQLGLTPKWQNSNFDTIFQSLAADQFDIVVAAVTAYAPKGSPAYTTVQQRRKIVSFTKPYYDSLQSLTVNSTKRSDIKSTDDLSSTDKVGVQSATTGAFYAQETLGDKVQLASFPKSPQMYDALDAGTVDAVLNDLPVSLEAAKEKKDLSVVQQINTGEQYAMAINQDNKSLLKAVNGALEKMYKDGSYAKIFTKYFPDQKLPSYAHS